MPRSTSSSSPVGRIRGRGLTNEESGRLWCERPFCYPGKRSAPGWFWCSVNGPSLQAEEIRDQLFPVVGQNTLRVELHALDRELAVTQAHDHSVAVRFGGAG